jgi:hypothetical protein
VGITLWVKRGLVLIVPCRHYARGCDGVYLPAHYFGGSEVDW